MDLVNMNRREFIKSVLKASAGISILTTIPNLNLSIGNSLVSPSPVFLMDELNAVILKVIRPRISDFMFTRKSPVFEALRTGNLYYSDKLIN